MTQAAETAKETALATVETDPALASVQAEERRFALAQRKAAVYAQSTLVPKEYQNNVGNVLIAENMAHRMGADTLMVMQNLYIVHNRPGWSSQFLIGTFNSNGRFTAIKYRFKGEQGSDDWGCQAYCTELSTGEEINGTWITWAMATAEGWTTKQGSKWRTMPEQMLRYRSASFLIRATAPEIGLGLLTKEELEDTFGPSGNGHSEPKVGIASLKDRLNLPSGTAATAAVDGELLTPDESEPVLDPPADDQAPDVTDDAKEVKDGAGDDESRLADLRTASLERFAELKGKQLEKAHKFLGTKGIPELGPDKLSDFLNMFGEDE